MSLSDCEECWSTICMCGHKYLTWSTEKLNELIDVLTKIRDTKAAEARECKHVKQPVGECDESCDVWIMLYATPCRHGKWKQMPPYPVNLCYSHCGVCNLWIICYQWTKNPHKGIACNCK